MLYLFSSAAALWVALASSVPGLTTSVSECQWATNDVHTVVAACTALLSTQNGPEPWMHFNRGLAYQSLGRFSEAESDYSRAIHLDPSYVAAYVNRGNVRLLRGDAAGGLADYRKAVKLDPKDRLARRNLTVLEKALRKIGGGTSGRSVRTAPID